MNSTTDRINDLAIESTQTVLDTASFLQRQNAALIESWFNTLEANQKTGRELARKAMKQAQEARALWLQYTQDNVKVTTETFARAAGTQWREVSEQLDTVTEQVKNSAKKAETTK
jgi:hypothetical protein